MIIYSKYNEKYPFRTKKRIHIDLFNIMLLSKKF